jgi:predicted DNA-binding transcriptional regulator
VVERRERLRRHVVRLSKGERIGYSLTILPPMHVVNEIERVLMIEI